jgi:hypothetical protein
MTVLQIILSISAVLQVCLLAIVSNTLIDIKIRLGHVRDAASRGPGVS